MAQLKITNAAWKYMQFLYPPNGASTYVVRSIFIFQGAYPTPTELYNLTSNIATNSGGGNRFADLLISYTALAGTQTTSADSNIVLSEATLKAATGTGNATWAAVCIGTNSDPGASSRMYIGDVTDTAGTGFLQMSNTSVMTGEMYKVLGLQMTMAYEYTF